MKNKKGIIILASVIAVCVVGLILSVFVDWNVDESLSGGNIGKSSRFSRKTATEAISNMEELLVNDENFRDGLVSAYMVMQVRTQHFNTLVNMSNEAAGDIPEYAELLKEMNESKEIAANVCASLIEAGENINAALCGEERPDLAQNTINASLAYTTLQKQNTLADKFIEITDKADVDDNVKFVRDQWVDYQMMSAALAQDDKQMKQLEKKGNLLSAEKSAAALNCVNSVFQASLYANANIAQEFNVRNMMAGYASGEIVANALNVCQIAGDAMMKAIQGLNGQENMARTLQNVYEGAVTEALANGPKILPNSTDPSALAQAAQVATLAKNLVISQNVDMASAANTLANANFNAVISSFSEVTAALRANTGAEVRQPSKRPVIAAVGDVVEAAALGQRVTLNFI
jgi:hypothetical protein